MGAEGVRSFAPVGWSRTPASGATHRPVSGAAHDRVMPADPQPPPVPKRILIVEDHDLNMKLLNDLLEAHGYDILQAREGVMALHLARQHRPDLILMDIQLPDISGLEATRLLKEDEHTKAIPIVAVTAFAMTGDKQRTLDSGCDAYVSKPIMVREFLRLVEELLARTPPRSDTAPC
jgi:two-component system cell cycle response regulator DivK